MAAITAAITLAGLSNVIVYAAASAGVGYVVKKVLEKLSAKIGDKCGIIGQIDPLCRTQIDPVIRCKSMVHNTELSISNIGDVGM